MYMLRCMGSKKFEEQCKNCARLPKFPEQEETEYWMIPNEKESLCSRFIEVKKNIKQYSH